MHADKETLHVKSLEHDFRDLLSVFWRVHGRFSKNEPMLLGLATKVGVDRLVPVSLDAFPVRNLPVSQDIADLVGLAARERLVADVIIHLLVEEALRHRYARFLLVVSMSSCLPFGH